MNFQTIKRTLWNPRKVSIVWKLKIRQRCLKIRNQIIYQKMESSCQVKYRICNRIHLNLKIKKWSNRGIVLLMRIACSKLMNLIVNILIKTRKMVKFQNEWMKRFSHHFCKLGSRVIWTKINFILRKETVL